MEIKGATYLYTSAALMITFAGFSALLFVIRQAAGAKLSILDRFIVRNILTYTFVLTGMALLPTLLALFEVPETRIWRISGLLFALSIVPLQASYPARRRKAVGLAPPFPIFAVFVVLSSAVTAAMLVCVLLSAQYVAAVYISALTIDFFAGIFGFVNALDIIMQQPIAPPDQAAD